MSIDQFFYDWDITKLESTEKVGDYSNVVTRVFWTLWGFDEHNNRAPLYGETEINVDQLHTGSIIEGWVNYNSLTKNQVEDMLEETLGEDEISRLTDNLKIQLQQLRQNTTTTQLPPWVS